MRMVRIKNQSDLEKQFISIIDKYMDEIVDFIFSESQKNIVENENIDQGFLLKSGAVTKKLLNKEINYSVDYADHIEYGSTAHYINASILVPWVRRKLNIKNDQEVWRVAYAIAQKIAKEGVIPSPYLRPAIDLASFVKTFSERD